MKRILTFVLVFAMAATLLFGCSTAKEEPAASTDETAATTEEPAGEPAATAEETTGRTAADVKIVLLLPGEVNDQGWNASNYAGVVACNDQLGTNMEYVEAVQEADFEVHLQGVRGARLRYHHGGRFPV